MLESFADPLLAMVVVVLGEGIETAKKRPAHAPRDAMINTDLVGWYDLRACDFLARRLIFASVHSIIQYI
jgi:hypothetical protein